MTDALPILDAPLPPKEFEQKLRLAKGAVGSLERAMKTRKLYTADHPLRQEATDEILARFQEFFNRHGYLRVDVTPRELKLDGSPVLVAEARDPEIPFRLYKDGIRDLRFNRGITREEVLAFLSVLETDVRQLAEMDEDLVSLLWSKDLHAIDFVAVDEFETDEGGAASADPDIRRVAQDVAAGIAGVMKSVAPAGEGGTGGGGGGGYEYVPPALPAASAPPPKDPDGPEMSEEEI